jgi:hypothetical protein
VNWPWSRKARHEAHGESCGCDDEPLGVREARLRDADAQLADTRERLARLGVEVVSFAVPAAPKYQEER